MAGSLNRAEIIGNLTRDPEVRQTPSGQMVATIGVATNHSWKDASGVKQEKVEFHNVVVWGKLAEICGQYLKKGSKVYFSGRMQTREWDTQDGQKRRTTEIIAQDMLMLGGGGGQGGSSESQSSSNDDGAPAPDEEGKIDVNDLPF